MKLRISPEEALRAKFTKTIVTISSVLAEASGDEGLQDWTASAVVDRVRRIKTAFDAEFFDLVKEVRVSPRRDEVKIREKTQ